MISAKKEKKLEEQRKLEMKRIEHYRVRIAEVEQVATADAVTVFRELFKDPPYNISDELIKDSFAVIFLMTMNNLKLEDVKTLLAKLSDDEAYTMLQFIYMAWKRIACGLQRVDKYCRSDILFKTHTLLVEKLGQSAIGKILCDPQSL
eukprot:TRINITY_DN10455_c0_g1_i11.p1 TRINITY_DN10455_c0_g1~~TRINITY_DN10455_c0_g1_i11.p1  ORF type:complete len:166 (-),score=60.61 TRINITY_DN10455_c0_g1_i11:148-591(-)